MREMTKKQWQKCRSQLESQKWWLYDKFRVRWHWNWGRPEQRIKEHVLWIEFIGQSGIRYKSGRTLSYKSLDSIIIESEV